MSNENLSTRAPSARSTRRRAPLLCALALAVPFVLAMQSGTAQAQERHGGKLALGVNAMLDGAGPFGPMVVYDAGLFHLEGIFGFEDVENDHTEFDLAGRFWYHIHSVGSADFSLGGGLGLVNFDPDAGDGTTDFEIDAGGQIRAFIVPNVAVSASLGLAILTGDSPTAISISGNFVGNAGIAYYF